MRNFLLFFSIILAIFVLAQAKDCDFDGKSVKVGEHYWPIGECTQYTCKEDGFTAVTCPHELAPPSCKYHPEDLSKPYPACCPGYEC